RLLYCRAAEIDIALRKRMPVDISCHPYLKIPLRILEHEKTAVGPGHFNRSVDDQAENVIRREGKVKRLVHLNKTQELPQFFFGKGGGSRFRLGKFHAESARGGRGSLRYRLVDELNRIVVFQAYGDAIEVPKRMAKDALPVDEGAAFTLPIHKKISVVL